MTYTQDVKAARERYETAVEQAETLGAADALRIAEQYDRPLSAVCKEIAGSGWSALRHRANRLKNDSPAVRRRTAEQLAVRRLRSAVKAAPEAAVREVAKVAPATVIEVAAEVAGQTRRAAPSNKAKVEQAFGPTEFNRFEDAADALLERLPDLAPNREDKKYAAELADKAEAIAQVLRAWARGESIGEEAAAWLREQ